MQRRPATASHTRRCTCTALAVLAAASLLSLLALKAASHVEPRANNDGHATIAAKAGQVRATVMERAPRPFPISVAFLVGAVTIAGAARWARGRTLLGLQRHRIDDDGDDWRSLLRGAPPALA